jgi:hypothetical protein
MNNEDMSEIIQKLNNMINISNKSENNTNTEQADVSSDLNSINEDTIKKLINNFNINNNTSNGNGNDNSKEENNQNNNNNFNFDINTILKMKNVMDKMNSSKNDPRSNLLLSLKPYLNNNRKEKLDQYMQFLNISKVIEAFNSDNGVDSK